jgi:hypothetical protein
MSIENDITHRRYKINLLTARMYNDMINKSQYQAQIDDLINEINALEMIQNNYDLPMIEKGV